MSLNNPFLMNYLRSLLGEEYPLFLKSKEEPPCIRVNTLKSSLTEVKDILHSLQVKSRPHPVNPDGLIIDQDDLPLSHSLYFFLGYFFYQGISSQIPALALDARPYETVLDMAASPGSKSMQIAASMQNKGRLLLNDASSNRQQPLMTNLNRAGVYNSVVMCTPGQRLGRSLPEYFDRILVDAPCSGINHLPDDIENESKWLQQKLGTLVNVQYSLLVSAIKAAKVGGVIVYSTCSMTIEENEQLLNSIIKKYPVQLESIPACENPSIRDGFNSMNGKSFDPDIRLTKRILPFPEPMEGFFVARLRKTAALTQRPAIHPIDLLPVRRKEDDEIASLLDHLEKRWGIDQGFYSDYNFILTGRKLWIVSNQWDEVPKNPYLMAGLPLAAKRYREWKLTNAGVQLLGDKITKSPLELHPQQLKDLFKQGKIAVTGINNGYYILDKEEKRLACVSVVNGVLRIHLPHLFHLVS